MDVAPPLPPDQQTFVTRLGRAAGDLTRARDAAVEGLAGPDPATLERAFSYAHKATGRLHEALADAPTFEVGSPQGFTRRAIEQANAGLAELSRASDDKPVSVDVVRNSWNSAVHSIGTAQGLVKHPPSTLVYDGS